MLYQPTPPPTKHSVVDKAYFWAHFSHSVIMLCFTKVFSSKDQSATGPKSLIFRISICDKWNCEYFKTLKIQGNKSLKISQNFYFKLIWANLSFNMYLWISKGKKENVFIPNLYRSIYAWTGRNHLSPHEWLCNRRNHHLLAQDTVQNPPQN